MKASSVGMSTLFAPSCSTTGHIFRASISATNIVTEVSVGNALVAMFKEVIALEREEQSVVGPCAAHTSGTYHSKITMIHFRLPARSESTPCGGQCKRACCGQTVAFGPPPAALKTAQSRRLHEDRSVKTCLASIREMETGDTAIPELG
jgi:hypothetical protein